MNIGLRKKILEGFTVVQLRSICKELNTTTRRKHPNGMLNKAALVFGINATPMTNEYFEMITSQYFRKLPSELIKEPEVKIILKPYTIAKELIDKRQLEGGRMGINDDLCNTNLISKNYSPMFIRKFNAAALGNWPLYVSMICDEDVSDIDKVVNGAIKAYHEAGLTGNNLQDMRNLTGIISETMSMHYNSKKENCVEGIAVTLYIDKAYIQSLSGDFMNHGQCRAEYTSALMMMTQI